MVSGTIIKAVAGLYTVKTDEAAMLNCRARGLFRHKDVTPLVGDKVQVELSEGNSGYIIEVEERKNQLVRPPIANIDQLCLVVSVCDPLPNFLVMDRLIALAEHRGIEPFIVVTKTDIEDGSFISDIYTKAGFAVCMVGKESGTEAVKERLAGKITVLAGNSGVGKSTLLNNIDPELALAVGETSKKLGRGRHTTRHVELFELKGGGLVADTPGFSSIEMEQSGVIFKDELENCFREFEDYIGECQFTGCSHRKEKGCAVLAAVKQGKISSQRHESYVSLYNEALEIKEWEYNRKN
ncbi:MAG: ribosome small subunit-dependent GTPase A [Oscillospiraceae bacterium]|nr:ribosome small subunit-dependent GTPase A [Oscillospiraceae bacterium]MBQ9938615.1 ribosome small subunit-dependent GTPase A [Oscillospiraceae bacterium]